jgi:hypothetical protein
MKLDMKKVLSDRISEMIDKVAQFPEDDRDEVFRKILDQLSTIHWCSQACDHGVKHDSPCIECELESIRYYESHSNCGEGCGGCEQCVDIDWNDVYDSEK